MAERHLNRTMARATVTVTICGRRRPKKALTPGPSPNSGRGVRE
jgi:hypothetical protein